MKRLLILFVLATIGFNSYALIIAFKWGTYEGNGKGCSPSFGLCYIELYSKQPKNELGNAEMINGKLNIWINELNVPLEFRESMKLGALTYNADYTLSPELCKQLKMETYTIRKGTYKFTIEDGRIHLIL